MPGLFQFRQSGLPIAANGPRKCALLLHPPFLWPLRQLQTANGSPRRKWLSGSHWKHGSCEPFCTKSCTVGRCDGWMRTNRWFAGFSEQDRVQGLGLEYNGPMKLLALAVMLSALGWAQGAPSARGPSAEVLSTWRTGGSLNGRFWREAGASQKRLFLLGYYDGVSHLCTLGSDGDFERYKQTMKAVWAVNLTIREVGAGLDAFYETAENSPIAIANAIHIVSLRSEGTDETILQKQIAELRARATQH